MARAGLPGKTVRGGGWQGGKLLRGRKEGGVQELQAPVSGSAGRAPFMSCRFRLCSGLSLARSPAECFLGSKSVRPRR